MPQKERNNIQYMDTSAGQRTIYKFKLSRFLAVYDNN
jgi:hypothetical protein